MYNNKLDAAKNLLTDMVNIQIGVMYFVTFVIYLGSSLYLYFALNNTPATIAVVSALVVSHVLMLSRDALHEKKREILETFE